MLTEVFSIVLVLSITGTVYGIFLRLCHPLLLKKISFLNIYRFYKYGLLLFYIPVGVVVVNLKIWMSADRMPIQSGALSEKHMVSANIYPVLSILNEKGKGYLNLISTIWFLGLFFYIGICLLRQAQYEKRLKKTSFSVKKGNDYEIFKECQKELGVKKGSRVQLRSNDGIRIPFGSGLFTYTVWIPEKKLEEEELRSIFLHELTHFLHRDILTKWITLITNGIHWYNPFFYYYHRKMNLQCELACDEEVIRHLTLEERKNYGLLLIHMLGVDETRGILTSSLWSGSRDLKSRLQQIAQPSLEKEMHFFFRLVILTFAFFIILVTSAAGWQMVRPWVNKFEKKSGNVASYQQFLAQENKIYEPFGIVYDQSSNGFYYKGDRIKIFLDERHISTEEKESCPWAQKVWECIHVDSNTDSDLYLKTVRNSDNEITHITYMKSEEAEEILNGSCQVLTFQSYFIGSSGFYASDRFDEGYPKEVISRLGDLKDDRGGWLSLSDQKESSGYLIYKGGQYPWKIEISDLGIMKVMLYSLEGGEAGKPTVIQYTQEQEIKEVKLYLDGKELKVQQIIMNGTV